MTEWHPYINQAHEEYMDKLFTGNLSHEDYRRLKELAEHKGVSMIGLIRMWVRRDHKKLTKEAGQ
jgi:hypothetical protein